MAGRYEVYTLCVRYSGQLTDNWPNGDRQLTENLHSVATRLSYQFTQWAINISQIHVVLTSVPDTNPAGPLTHHSSLFNMTMLLILTMLCVTT